MLVQTIYSLGCVMFETLTGSPPHKGESAIETLMFHVNDRHQSLASVARDIGECAELEKIVAAALEATPDLRYQTVSKLKEDLERRKFSNTGCAIVYSWFHIFHTFCLFHIRVFCVLRILQQRIRIWSDFLDSCTGF